MKNIALTILNETELEVFNKKIDAIKTFVDAFGQNTISFISLDIISLTVNLLHTVLNEIVF